MYRSGAKYSVFLRICVYSHFIRNSDRRFFFIFFVPLVYQKSIQINATVTNACEQVRRGRASGKEEMVARGHSRHGHSIRGRSTSPFSGRKLPMCSAMKISRFNLRPPRKVSPSYRSLLARSRSSDPHRFRSSRCLPSPRVQPAALAGRTGRKEGGLRGLSI